MASLVTPTLIKQPSEGGTLTAVPTEYSGDYYFEYQNYRYVAKANAGWRFDGFIIQDIVINDTGNSEYDPQAGPHSLETIGVYDATTDSYHYDATNYEVGVAWWYDPSLIPGLEPYYDGPVYVDSLSVTAKFSKSEVPRSNLLVNSYNRSTPVHLVHDPATNLLVADYLPTLKDPNRP